jgi:hypothetical protein
LIRILLTLFTALISFSLLSIGVWIVSAESQSLPNNEPTLFNAQLSSHDSTAKILGNKIARLTQVSSLANNVQPDEFLLSKGSFHPRSPLMGGSASPITVFSDNIRNNSGLLDFGQVPATMPPDFIKFLPPYQAIFYVTNTAGHNISITSIELADVQSPQPTSPFNFCGTDYNRTSIHLSPGYSQTFAVCFYPNTTGVSNATMVFFNESDLLGGISITGNGIPSSYSMLTGSEFVKGPDNQNVIDNENITKKIGDIPALLSNRLQGSNASPLFIGTAESECSVKIEGGGQRPNPDVNGAGLVFDGTNVRFNGPINTNAETPPDDGLNLLDFPHEHLHKINVGELVNLNAAVNGVLPQNIQSIQWTVSDPKIKDYNETLPGKFTTSNLTTEEYQKPSISFYWKDTGNKNVTVSVKARINNQLINCGDSRTFVVERNNDDINRQAEDFYIFNHNATVLFKHVNWHIEEHPIDYICEPRPGGESFFVFHKGIISTFDSWRKTFGYENITAWDPATDLPQGIDGYDVNRFSPYQPQLIPSYLTDEGGNTYSICSAAGSSPQGYNYNITKLSDFTNASDLANELEASWHGQLHMMIGGRTPDGFPGNMAAFNLAPKDPVFWGWHKYLDENIYDIYREVKGMVDK